MFEKVTKNLQDRGFSVSCFETGAEASAYLNEIINGRTVGFGGSMTLEELGLYDSLSAHNTLFWHHRIPAGKTSLEVRTEANAAEVYLSSVNGLAETGEIINIDNACNRVASIFYGHEQVYLLVGRNKLAPDYDKALWRARNIASPKNAQRLGRKTPCAVKADRCYDCKSPDRICRGLAVLWEVPMGTKIEVLLINEDLGY